MSLLSRTDLMAQLDKLDKAIYNCKSYAKPGTRSFSINYTTDSAFSKTLSGSVDLPDVYGGKILEVLNARRVDLINQLKSLGVVIREEDE